MTPCQTKVNKIVTLNCIKNDQPYFCYTIDCIYPSTQVMKTCSVGLSNFNVLTEKLQSFPICSTIHSMLFHSLFFKRWKNKKELCLITKLQKGFWPKLILIYHNIERLPLFGLTLSEIPSSYNILQTSVNEWSCARSITLFCKLADNLRYATFKPSASFAECKCHCQSPSKSRKTSRRQAM